MRNPEGGNVKINPLVQLEALLASCSSVAIEHPGPFTAYEVTVYRGRGIDHSHFGGATLAEAINRALRSEGDPR